MTDGVWPSPATATWHTKRLKIFCDLVGVCCCARGRAHQTAHYAICTGFMALGMMIPGMWSGWLQELIGYQHFFLWVILATIPSFIVVLLIPLDKEFGKKA